MAAVPAVSAAPAETTGGNGAGAYRCGVAARAAGTACGAVAEDDALSTVAGGPAGTAVVAGGDGAVGEGSSCPSGSAGGTVTTCSEDAGAAFAAGAAGGTAVGRS